MSIATPQRPEIVTDEHLEYLDDLRESGETNTFGASEYIEYWFDNSKNEARIIAKYWMKSFGDKNR